MRSPRRVAPVAVTKPCGSSRSSCARMSATASAWAGGGAAGNATSHLMRAQRAPSRRAPTMSSVVGVSASATRCAAPRTRRGVHTGAGASTVDRGVGAVVEQRGQRTVGIRAEHQAGARIQLAFNGFDRRRHRQPQQPADAGAHRGVLLGRLSRTPARRPRFPRRRTPGSRARCGRRWPRSTVRGSSSRSSGQVRSPLRSSPPATASATACRAGAASCSCSAVEVLAARDLGAVGGLDGERHAQVRRAACRGRRRRSARARRCAAATFPLQRLAAAVPVPARARPAPRARCRARERSCGAGLLAAIGSAR